MILTAYALDSFTVSLQVSLVLKPSRLCKEISQRQSVPIDSLRKLSCELDDIANSASWQISGPTDSS